ncbi:sulfur carrier protein ThiS [Candidimonas nitroreducens]|uniref:sulfur carrier protein ThiS n=1 Tax=Candidimonas nitroreducens TaxID=683354 RepID=UPI0018E995BA|nr:sulfur carrier protein ThiS [Candidimonas nitroreducens]
MNTIRITVNGVEHTVAASSTLQDLLDTLRPEAEPGAPIASAVNGTHVARQARATLVLQDRDAITTFEPITGG